MVLLDEMSKKDIPDSEFGIPETRKYPLIDESHVLSAIKFFNYVDSKYEEKLAKRIIKKIHEYNMEDRVNVGNKNRFSKYWRKPKKESYNINNEPIVFFKPKLFYLEDI